LYLKVSILLQSVAISIDHLPPCNYSLNAAKLYLLPLKPEINRPARDDIYREFIPPTPQPLNPKLAFYVETFLRILDGSIG
jgi:hypothetical protein